MTEIRQAIRQFIVDTFLFGQDDGFADNASFLERGIIDSTGVLELVSFLETTYSLSISDDELIAANLDSLDSVSTFVARKRAGTTAVSS